MKPRLCFAQLLVVLLLLLSFSACGPFHADMAVSWGASSIHREVTISNPADSEDAVDEADVIIPQPVLPAPQ